MKYSAHSDCIYQCMMRGINILEETFHTWKPHTRRCQNAGMLDEPLNTYSTEPRGCQRALVYYSSTLSVFIVRMYTQHLVLHDPLLFLYCT